MGAHARYELSPERPSDPRSNRIKRVSHARMARRTDAAREWAGQLRTMGQLPSLNLGLVMGPDFAQSTANLARNLLEGRLEILTAVFKPA
jgi:hypothetical protein